MPPSSVAVYRSFRDPVLGVWPYWSRPDLLERWLGPTHIELIPGGDFNATLWNGDRLQGMVVEVAPPNRLDLTWRSEGPDIESAVRIQLEHQGPGSRVSVLQEDPGSDLERAHVAAWWRAALDALHAAVDGVPDASHWGDSLPIVLRAPLSRAASDIWPLLATGPGLEKWLAGADHFDASPGSAFRFRSRFQGNEVIEEGTVQEVEPERRLALTWEWTGQGWQAPTRVEFRLEPDTTGAALVIRHSGFEALAAEQRLAARTNYAAAWRDVMQDLQRLVAPGPTG